MTTLREAAQQAPESTYHPCTFILIVGRVEPLYLPPLQRKPVVVSVDELANHIRVVDGNHSLGAGALAEKIVEFLIERAHGIGEQP